MARYFVIKVIPVKNDPIKEMLDLAIKREETVAAIRAVPGVERITNCGSRTNGGKLQFGYEIIFMSEIFDAYHEFEHVLSAHGYEIWELEEDELQKRKKELLRILEVLRHKVES